MKGGLWALSKIYVAGYGKPELHESGGGGGCFFRLLLTFLFLVVMLGGALVAMVELYPPQGMLILEYHKINDRTKDDYTVPPT